MKIKLEKIKGFIRRYGGETAHRAIFNILMTLRVNNKIILFSAKKAVPNKVNVNYWSGANNLGDIISPVIVDYVARYRGIDPNKFVSKTRHLYAVGSVITAGCQDCTVWGSGILNFEILYRLKKRNLDVRAVRGPITRMILQEHGCFVPEIYGDPAVLMPMLYNPDVKKRFKASVITHMNEAVAVPKDCNRISILTDDYRGFVDNIKASELVISSSLHGIIFAEAYGVPAVLLRPSVDLLKYYDYYYGTGRYQFPIADSIEDALKMVPAEIPNFEDMQNNLIASFPVDLWE